MAIAANPADLITTWGDVMTPAQWLEDGAVEFGRMYIAMCKAFIERDLIQAAGSTYAEMFAEGLTSFLNEEPYVQGDRHVEGRLYSNAGQTYVSGITQTDNPFITAQQVFNWKTIHIEVSPGVYATTFSNPRFNTSAGTLIVDFPGHGRVNQDVTAAWQVTSTGFNVYEDAVTTGLLSVATVGCDDTGWVPMTYVDENTLTQTQALSATGVTSALYQFELEPNYIKCCLPGTHLNPEKLLEGFHNKLQANAGHDLLGGRYWNTDTNLSTGSTSDLTQHGEGYTSLAKQAQQMYKVLRNMEHFRPPAIRGYGRTAWLADPAPSNAWKTNYGLEVFGDVNFTMDFTSTGILSSMFVGQVNVALDADVAGSDADVIILRRGLEVYRATYTSGADIPIIIDRTDNILTITVDGVAAPAMLDHGPIDVGELLPAENARMGNFNYVKGEMFWSRTRLENAQIAGLDRDWVAHTWDIDTLNTGDRTPYTLTTPHLPKGGVVSVVHVQTIGDASGTGNALCGTTLQYTDYIIAAGDNFELLVPLRTPADLTTEERYVYADYYEIVGINMTKAFPCDPAVQSRPRIHFLASEMTQESVIHNIPLAYDYTHDYVLTDAAPHSVGSSIYGQILGAGIHNNGIFKLTHAGELSLSGSSCVYGAGGRNLAPKDYHSGQLYALTYRVENRDNGRTFESDFHIFVHPDSYHAPLEFELFNVVEYSVAGGSYGFNDGWGGFLAHWDCRLTPSEVSGATLSGTVDKLTGAVLLGTTTQQHYRAPNMALRDSTQRVGHVIRTYRSDSPVSGRFVQDHLLRDIYQNYWIEETDITVTGFVTKIDQADVFDNLIGAEVTTLDVSWDGPALAINYGPGTPSLAVFIAGGAGSFISVAYANEWKETRPISPGQQYAYSTYYGPVSFTNCGIGYRYRERKASAVGVLNPDVFVATDCSTGLYSSSYYGCNPYPHTGTYGCFDPVGEPCVPSANGFINWVQTLYYIADIFNGAHDGVWHKRRDDNSYHLGDRRDFIASYVYQPGLGTDTNQSSGTYAERLALNILFGSAWVEGWGTVLAGQNMLVYRNDQDHNLVSVAVGALTPAPTGAWMMFFPEIPEARLPTSITFVTTAMVIAQQKHVQQFVGFIEWDGCSIVDLDVDAPGNTVLGDEPDARYATRGVQVLDVAVDGSGGAIGVILKKLLSNAKELVPRQSDACYKDTVSRYASYTNYLTLNASFNVSKTVEAELPDVGLQPNVQLWSQLVEAYTYPLSDPEPAPTSLSVFGETLTLDTVVSVPDLFTSSMIRVGTLEADRLTIVPGASTVYSISKIGEGDPAGQAGYTVSSIISPHKLDGHVQFYDAYEANIFWYPVATGGGFTHELQQDATLGTYPSWQDAYNTLIAALPGLNPNEPAEGAKQKEWVPRNKYDVTWSVLPPGV